MITIPNTNTTYNVNGTNPVGTVSVGSANGLRTITNVAAGRVSETSTDAVNGSELYAVATEAAKHTTITTEEGSRITVDSKTNLAGGTEYILDFDSFGLANSSLNNLTNQGKTVITNLAKEVERHIKPVTYAVDKNGTVTMTYVNGKGETVNNMTATITGIAKSDLSNITEEGDTYITQVANKAVKVIDGENTTVTPGKDGDVTTYAVNVDTSGKIEQNNTNIVTGDTVYNALQNVSWKAQVNGNNAKTVAKDGTLNFIDGDNIDITSNDNGDIKISTTGLASSGDLWTAQAGGTDVKAVNQKVNFVGSDHITVTGTDGQIKFEATGLADTDLTNITNDAITKIQNIAKGEDVHIKSDTYTVGNDGSVTMTYVDGNGNKVDGTAKITGIAKSDLTNITEGGKTVINNLAKEAVKVVDGTNTNVETVPTTDGHAEYKVNLDKDVNLGDTIYLNGSDGSISAKSGGAQLAFNSSGLTVSQAKNGLTNETRIDGATITVDGSAGNQTIINGSTAHIGSVLVNGGSGTATITGLTNKTTDYTGFANGSGRAATEEQLKEVAGKAGEAIETAGQGWNLTTNGKESSKTNIKPGGTVDFSSSNDNLLISNAGADLSFSLSDNLDLTKNDSKKGSVKVGENTTLTDGLLQVGTDVSLTASALNVGKSSLTTSALTVGGSTYINSSGINANGNRITGVAAGIEPMDAVNVSQLYKTNQAVIANAENINSLSHSLNKLDSRINRVGAGAAALAALHPLDFDPDNKWDFAAGYGNYAGANAVAIGTYYRPNENTMFSIGGSFGGGENMINAGVSFKLGSGGSGITTSKTVMAKKIKEQDELLKAQDAKMKEQDEKIAKLEALVAQQGEMIQQALGKK